jgi:F0F1-type ATP synthase membrane subunit b/b'
MVHDINIQEIVIAVIATGILTTVLTSIINRRKYNADTDRVEQNIVGDRIDQADKVVTMATQLLEDVQAEREKLRVEKETLEIINDNLTAEIDKLKLNIKTLEDRI